MQLSDHDLRQLDDAYSESLSHAGRAHNARYAIELIRPSAVGSGLVVHQTKHLYLERRCDGAHWTWAERGR